MADAFDTVTPALQQERRAHFLHQIGRVVGGRAIDAQAHANSGLFQVANRAVAGGEDLIAAWAMGH